jgi:Na+-translocating ferredoxin:NAD+ oxidoreductase subunit B
LHVVMVFGWRERYGFSSEEQEDMLSPETIPVYEALAGALSRLPAGFDRTASGIELSVLEFMFKPEEAAIAAVMSEQWETSLDIAGRLGLERRPVEAQLRLMSQKLLTKSKTVDSIRRFRLNAFMVGSYEAQLFRMDHQFAHLMEEYIAETGGLRSIMRAAPAVMRVLPAQSALKAERILPYEDVRAIISEANGFDLHDCICRKEQSLVGKDCHFPLRTCLTVYGSEGPKTPTRVSREEALEFLDRAEEIGLVHIVSNVVHGIEFICNCCNCCCGILRSVVEYGVKESVATASYSCSIAPGNCSACAVCVGRCPVHAIHAVDGVYIVDTDTCIGCGLCVSTCPGGAARLSRRPTVEVVTTPETYEDWEEKRRKHHEHH